MDLWRRQDGAADTCRTLQTCRTLEQEDSEGAMGTYWNNNHTNTSDFSLSACSTPDSQCLSPWQLLAFEDHLCTDTNSHTRSVHGHKPMLCFALTGDLCCRFTGVCVSVANKPCEQGMFIEFNDTPRWSIIISYAIMLHSQGIKQTVEAKIVNY